MFKEFLAFVDATTSYQKVLDFGCGPGPVLANMLEDLGKDVSCFDPYFFPNNGYLNEKYDLITVTEVFEHLSNPFATLSCLKTLLQKDGAIAIMTNFHKDDLEHFKSWWYKLDPTHIGFYTPKTFHLLAQRLSLHVKACDGIKYTLLTHLDSN